MPELYEFVMENVFCGFMSRDTVLLRAIGSFEEALDIQEDTLRFTLPALYEFACESFEATAGAKVSRDRKGFLEFRRALYRNPTNSRLRTLGGRVELETPNPDHDLVVYKLVRATGAC